LAKAGRREELDLVSTADAVTQPKPTVVKLERLVMTRCGDRLFYIARQSTDFHRLHATDTGNPSNASRRRLPFSIFAARAITHCTSQKAELFCKICMMSQAAMMIA